MRIRPHQRVVVLGAVLALGAAACSSGSDTKNTDGSKPGGASAKPSASTAAVSVGTAADSTGPAKAIPEAKNGGTALVLERADFNHLDPARVYVSHEQTVMLLLSRQLTTFKAEGDRTILVGDLATDTGSTPDGGKTWKFTLKDNLKYEDGSTIKAADVKYGVERSFAKEITGGPTWIQEWLTGKSADFRTVYDGPYGGKSYDAIEAPDDKTVVFHLAAPRADFPFAVAMQTSSPVPKDKDTKLEFDKHPFSSGPYKIASRDVDKGMVLTRNENWKPETDAVRHAYPDQWKFEFGAQNQQINERLMAANGEDKNAMTFRTAVGREVAQKVLETPDLKARTADAFTPFAEYFEMNNKRVTDPKIRQAVVAAFPKQQVRQILGGPAYGELSTTLMSPTVLGFEKYDSAGVPPTGDPEKAKQILATSSNPTPTIAFAFPQTPMWEQVSVAINEGLTKAGFKVVAKPINDKSYYTEIGRTANEYDLYWSGWGADWPSGITVLPAKFDGRKIQDDGTVYSLYNNPAVSAEMDRISNLSDVTAAGKEWAALDKKIMTEDAPVVPFVYRRQLTLYGPGLGGVRVGFIGSTYPTDVWVK
ncbi:ABC transporter substrate-binding protein [Yinghuangia seranimata]|uniref:ABC transporter substrate-binding protein n=1 Tax=Yinghuangia seranimata TaxID=408067 RepID=UPI00248CEA20|nr:ABC transporter substrate-binding protein [Yinghuangia seranimata]MDI2132045.1 ABC transporter substrate-binding protein [Yinghuangia seranimata]